MNLTHKLRAQETQLQELRGEGPWGCSGRRGGCGAILLPGTCRRKQASGAPLCSGRVTGAKTPALLGPCEAHTRGHHSSRQDVAHELASTRWSGF